MEFIQRLVSDIATVVEWEGRVLRGRVMRICWGAALALLSVGLVFVTLLMVLAAVYLQVSASGGAIAGLLAASALALLCSLGAGLAARGVSER
jgi:hypothetical protein